MGHMIIRIHQQPRKHLFLPHEAQDLPCPLESLLPQRLTLIQHDGIHVVTPRQDDWQAHFDPAFVDREWTGCTEVVLSFFNSRAGGTRVMVFLCFTGPF